MLFAFLCDQVQAGKQSIDDEEESEDEVVDECFCAFLFHFCLICILPCLFVFMFFCYVFFLVCFYVFKYFSIIQCIISTVQFNFFTFFCIVWFHTCRGRCLTEANQEEKYRNRVLRCPKRSSYLYLRMRYPLMSPQSSFLSFSYAFLFDLYSSLFVCFYVLSLKYFSIIHCIISSVQFNILLYFCCCIVWAHTCRLR